MSTQSTGKLGTLMNSSKNSPIEKKIGKPTVHFHGDLHKYYEKEGGGYDVDNYLRISLDGESIAPPIRVEIDVSKENQSVEGKADYQ